MIRLRTSEVDPQFVQDVIESRRRDFMTGLYSNSIIVITAVIKFN